MNDFFQWVEEKIEFWNSVPTVRTRVLSTVGVAPLGINAANSVFLGWTVGAVVTFPGNPNNWYRSHWIGRTTQSLRMRVEAEYGLASILPLLAIQTDIDLAAFNGNPALPAPIPTAAPPSAPNFVNPATALPPFPPATPAIVQPSPPIVIEVISSMYQISSGRAAMTDMTSMQAADLQYTAIVRADAAPPAAGLARPNYFFHGPERVLMQKGLAVFKAMVARDEIAAAATPTAKISNRVRIFDPDDADQLHSVFLLVNQLEYLLSIERSR